MQSTGLTLSALLRLQSTTLVNLNDHSVREYAALVRSLSDQSELVLGGVAGFGETGSEFKGYLTVPGSEKTLGWPGFVFGYFKYYF